MNISLGGTMEFWVGEIRNIQDPDGGGGKIKVVAYGHHNAGDTPIPDEDLPWAHALMNNSPSLNGIGESVHYLPGSTVVGFWLDPQTKQIPIILGSLHRSALPDYNDPQPV